MRGFDILLQKARAAAAEARLYMAVSRGRLTARLFSLPAIVRDVHDLVFEDEKIGSALAGQPHHVLVVIFDPAGYSLTVHQFHGDRLLLLAQSFEEAGLFESLFRRRSPATLGGVGISRRAEGHSGIVHAA
jgi:hypothetical protein